MFPISEEDAQLQLWIIDRRHSHQSTIKTSLYEPAEWLDHISIPVAAKEITDGLAAQAYKNIIGSNTQKRTVR